jgi:hypothetical protein
MLTTSVNITKKYLSLMQKLQRLSPKSFALFVQCLQVRLEPTLKRYPTLSTGPFVSDEENKFCNIITWISQKRLKTLEF